MFFQNILFPVDFSKSCKRVAPCVAAMQTAMSARLVLLHSIDLPSDWPTQDAVNELIDYESIRASDYGRLKRFAANHFADRHPDLIQETGDAAAAISRCVEARHIDLVMMPTHGYGFFRRALLGSVTTKVLHDGLCSVWTASHNDTAPNPACKHILVAVEDPERSLSLLRVAGGLADTLGADLHIVHAYPDLPGAPAERSERHIPEQAENSIRRRLDALQKSAGTAAPTVIAGGEVNDVIAETARTCQADLVIAGRGSFGGFLESMRPHLYYIIRSSPCPVLVLSEAAQERHETVN